MGILKIKKIKKPNFDLEAPFCDDVWKIKEWDFYQKSPEAHQKSWKRRSSKYDYNMDFTIINNLTIREELKYCMKQKYDSGINLSTFGYNFDFVKKFADYFNHRDYSSIIETDFDDFNSYLESKGLKTTINNGTRVNISEAKVVTATKRSKFASFLDSCIEFVTAYIEKDTDPYEKDIWNTKDFPTLDSNDSFTRNIDFSSINNIEFKIHLKAFCKNRMSVITFDAIYNYANKIKYFYSWLEEKHPEIVHLNQLNRELMEEYFIWLRTSSGLSRRNISMCILDLKVFFEIGSLLELENFPEFDLILNTDYGYKSSPDPQYLTDEELKSVIKIIPELPSLYGKILYCLVTLGCRVSEVLNLKIKQIKRYPDGKYYLLLHQHKTKAEYEKSIPDSAAKLIESEITKNKKRFGENAVYVFAGEKADKPIVQSTLVQNINVILVKNKVKDRNGNPLHCNTHRLRATLATNLLKGGTDVKAVGKLLGQKSISSLAYYAAVTKEETKEQLKGRIEKDQLLISNIGKIDDKVLSEYNNPIPLCNGWCVKSPTLGLCEKANHCLECNFFVPTFAHLAHYERQLRETEAAIAAAEANSMELLLQKNLKTKENLEKIIAKIRERRTNYE